MERDGSMAGFLLDIGGKMPLEGNMELDLIVVAGDSPGALMSPMVGDIWALACLF